MREHQFELPANLAERRLDGQPDPMGYPAISVLRRVRSDGPVSLFLRRAGYAPAPDPDRM